MIAAALRNCNAAPRSCEWIPSWREDFNKFRPASACTSLLKRMHASVWMCVCVCVKETSGEKTNNGIHYRLQLLYSNGKTQQHSAIYSQSIIFNLVFFFKLICLSAPLVISDHNNDNSTQEVSDALCWDLMWREGGGNVTPEACQAATVCLCHMVSPFSGEIHVAAFSCV